jgi:cytochrome P450
MSDTYDFYSDEFQSDPPATYRRMMAHCPVHRSDTWGWYSVFRNADIQTIINDHQTYSVRKGPGPMNTEGNPGILVATDPPQHMLEKRLVGRVFNLSLMESFEPELRQYVARLLDDVARSGRCDFIEDVAIPVPLWIICRLLDVDFERWGRQMRDWVYVLAGAVFSQDRDMSKEVLEASTGLLGFLEPLVDAALAKRDTGEAPGAGLLDRLAAAEVDGMRLDKDQLMGFGSFVVIAGSGTTTNSIGNFFAAMLDHPDQFALLRQRPELLPNAVDEVIRFYAPVPGLFRTNNKPVTLQGVEIPADSKICVMWGSGNRDPELFERPDELDITRDLDELKRRNLSFGGGIHRCMGAPLSRMEIRVVVEEWLKRIPEFHEYQPRVPYPYATLIGDDHLYLEWEAAER